MLPFELTKDTPYLALSGELWSVFYEYFNRNWSCYKGFLLYHVIHVVTKDILKFFNMSNCLFPFFFAVWASLRSNSTGNIAPTHVVILPNWLAEATIIKSSFIGSSKTSWSKGETPLPQVRISQKYARQNKIETNIPYEWKALSNVVAILSLEISLFIVLMNYSLLHFRYSMLYISRNFDQV